MALIAAVFSTAVNVLVKDLIQRPRPTAAVVHVLDTINSYSFPSGHVMFYLGFFGFIWFLAFSLLKPSLKRGLLLVFFSSLVVLIGISRIYVGEHWASDVLGSYLLGTLTPGSHYPVLSLGQDPLLRYANLSQQPQPRNVERR